MVGRQLKSLDDMLSWARQRAAAAQASTPAEAPAPAVQLPLWPEPVRGVPNGFLRSALFGAIRKGRRRFVKGERLAALDGIEIHYTGERLDQGDLDVYENSPEIASRIARAASASASATRAC